MSSRKTNWIIGTIGMTVFIGFAFLIATGKANFLLAKYYYWHGYKAQDNRELQKAIAYFDETTKVDSTHQNAYISRGSAYLDLEEYGKAIDNYTIAIRLDKGDARPLAYRGRAFYESGQIQMALDDLGKAIALDPDFAYAYSTRALILYTELNDYEQACKDLNKASDLGDKEAKSYLLSGTCD